MKGGGFMKARDVMEPLTDYLSPDNTLKEAIYKMRVCRRDDVRTGVKGMVVLDKKQKLVGMLSLKDILRTIMPYYMELMRLGEFTWDGMLEDKAEEIVDRRVAEVMTRKVLTVPLDAPLMECADFIVRQNLQRLPVVDHEQRVVGMVYIRDLYHVLTGVLFKTNDICAL